MSIVQITIFAITTAYLIIQSIFDIRSKKVLVCFNHLALIISIGLYLIDMVQIRPIPFLELLQTTLLIIILICLSKYARWFGSGDAKAMLVIALMLRYLSDLYPYVDIMLFLITLFISNFLFYIFHTIRNRILKKQESRHAYFPFLTIGYVMTCLIVFIGK